MAAKHTKTPKAPATKVTVGALLTKPAPAPAPKANGAAKVITEDDVIAFLEAQKKGSDILKRARNTVWRKIAEKQVDSEVKKVIDELVALKGFEAVKLAYLATRKEQPKAETKESEEATE